MNKLFKFAQAKSKWHKFPSFDLRGGAKLYKNFAQKLLAVSLCMAVVLCTVPLRGGSHVSEAGDSEGTVMTLTADGTDLNSATVKAEWTAFDLSSPPALAAAGLLPSVPHVVCAANSLSTATFATFDTIESRYSYVDTGFGAQLPRCLGCWSSLGSVLVSTRESGAAVVQFPQLRGRALLRWSTSLAFGTSVSWSPSVEAPHCDEHPLTLSAGACTDVLDNGDGSWTITRTGSGDDILDVTIGNFKVGEVTVTEPAASDDPAPDPAAYLETTVDVLGTPQRIRVYDPNGVLPMNPSIFAEYVDASHGDHNFFITHLDPATDVERQHFYNIMLTRPGWVASQLDGPVELWFEAIDGIDAADSFISRLAEGLDAKLEPTLYTDADGVTWIKVLTDHFSPYALTDLLSEEEKATLAKENSGPKNNVKTGDITTQMTVAGLGMTLVLALGIMLRLLTSKKKFEE